MMLPQRNSLSNWLANRYLLRTSVVARPPLRHTHPGCRSRALLPGVTLGRICQFL